MARNTLGIKYFLGNEKLFLYIDQPTHWYCFTDKTYNEVTKEDQDECEKAISPKCIVSW